jgi:hypothetical protein
MYLKIILDDMNDLDINYLYDNKPNPVIPVGFLKDKNKLLILEQGFAKTTLKIVSSLREEYNYNKYLKNIDDLLAFSHIDTPKKMLELVAILTLNKFTCLNSRYRALSTPQCHVPRDILTQAPSYSRNQDQLFIINKTHYVMHCDCLCDEHGRLSRIQFEIKNDVLSITEVKNYTEKSSVEYYMQM